MDYVKKLEEIKNLYRDGFITELNGYSKSEVDVILNHFVSLIEKCLNENEYLKNELKKQTTSNNELKNKLQLSEFNLKKLKQILKEQTNGK